jgi:hypothetical protein
METKALFEPETLPAELAGLTPDMLANLYDAALKFGADLEGADVRRLCAKSPKEIYVSVVVPPSAGRSMMISCWPGNINVADAHYFVLRDGCRSWVRWHKSFTVDDIVQFLAGVDAEMAALGAVNPATGVRSRKVSPTHSDWKLRVDEVFAVRGKMVQPVMPAEMLREQFDRPHDVAVYRHPSGRDLLCRAGDLSFIRKRMEALSAVLRRRGIVGLADVDRLSKEERRAIFAEADALVGDLKH